MQYVTPSVQFVLGVARVPRADAADALVGFALIWLALALFTLRACGTAASSCGSGRREVPA